MENFFGKRIELARKKAKLSLKDLSEKIDEKHKVSSQTLNKYENGSIIPKKDVLDALMKALNIDETFLFKSHAVEVESMNIDFRKISGLNKYDKDNIEYVVWDLAVSTGFDENKEFNFKAIIRKKEDIITAVRDLKKKLNIPLDQPIKSCIDVAWKINKRAWKIKGLSENVDGLMATITTSNEKEENVIVINENFKGLERQRFTIMHEIAHSILDFDENIENIEVERLCNYFASEFLIPSEAVKNNFTKAFPAFEEIISFKHKYGVSAAAVLYKLANLELISENTHRWIYMTYGKGWRKKEPRPIENISSWEKVPSEMKKVFEYSCNNNLIDKELKKNLVM